MGRAIRIAAVGDVHVTAATNGALRRSLADVPERADVLLLAGDLTDHGQLDEAETLVAEVRDLGLPTVAVLGNHDHDGGRATAVADRVRSAGVTVLDGDAVRLTVGGTSVGIGGAKGFAGGFAGARVHRFGEDEMKRFAEHAHEAAGRLRTAMEAVDADVRVALMHYAPVRETLVGEPPELYPWLGSYLLAEAVDAAGGADIAVHGHAHYGSPDGVTPGGTPVRNVARPVLRAPYAVFTLTPGRD